MAPGSLLAAWLRQCWGWYVARDTPGVHGFVWGRATLLPALRCMRCGAPRECYTGLRGQPAGPRGGDEAMMCA